MFSLLRIVLVVGVIFYLSPVRQGGDPLAAIGSLVGWASEPQAPAAQPPATRMPAADAPGKLETAWQALPETAKQALVNEIVSHTGVGTKQQAATDTLHAEDKKPAWRGESAKPQT